MNFVLELFSKRTKFMCKNENFQSSGTKNVLFKVQERKTNFMQNLETKFRDENNSLTLNLYLHLDLFSHDNPMVCFSTFCEAVFLFLLVMVGFDISHSCCAFFMKV